MMLWNLVIAALGSSKKQSQVHSIDLAGRSEPARLLGYAAAKLRSGEGWEEGTTADVLNEVLHAYPLHVKKALVLALLSGEVLRSRRRSDAQTQ